MAEAVDVEGFAYVAKDEEALHFDLCAAGADGSGDVVQEAEVACADVRDLEAFTSSDCTPPQKQTS